MAFAGLLMLIAFDAHSFCVRIRFCCSCLEHKDVLTVFDCFCGRSNLMFDIPTCTSQFNVALNGIDTRLVAIFFIFGPS